MDCLASPLRSFGRPFARDLRSVPVAINQTLDAIYFLMFPGWDRELRSNRWHYASRWARHTPVTLVQTVPALPRSKSHAVAETRIENCRILYVRASGWGDRSLPNGLIQIEQIRRDISANGFDRVMFWMYDPSYFLTWGMLPATVRVVHATENYFMFSNHQYMSSDHKTVSLRRLIFCLQHADATICCSDGVNASFRPHSGGHVETVTNGCDRNFYAAGNSPDRAIAALRGKFDRVAVFAGNVDGRLDYVVMGEAADRNPKVLFLLVGPKNFQEPEHGAAFNRFVRRPNSRHFDTVPVERLPSIYAACDVGMLPYVRKPLLYENGFPLKTFEMIAAGLPIVVQNLMMIEPFAGEGIVYARNDADFAAAFRTTARAALSDSGRDRLAALARAQDYDAKFETACRIVGRIARSSRPTAPMRELFSADPSSFHEPSTAPMSGRFCDSTLWLMDSARHAARTMAWSLPHPVRRRLRRYAPDWLFRFIES